MPHILQIRDINKFNDSLLAKVSWRILTKPNCLLARVLLGKYCQSSNFLECSTPSSASHGWRGICIGRDLLKPRLGKLIGSGTSTPIWKEPWLSLSKPELPMGPANANSQGLMVSHLINQEDKEWNKDLIRDILPQYEKDILKLIPSKKGAPDKWAWLPTASGIYSAKSGYYEAVSADPEMQDTSIYTTDFNWRAHIWSTKSSPKTKLLLWKAMQNALPVGENLKHRKINNSAQCPHCGEDETILHLFFTCSFARNVWSKVPCKTPLDLDSLLCLKSGIEAAKRLLCLPPVGIGDGPLFPWICWTLWNVRNQRIFQDRVIQADETLLQGILKAKEWHNAQITKAQPCTSADHPNRVPASMRPPTPTQEILCNTDAAWREDLSAGFGWIFSNQAGMPLHQGSEAKTLICSPLMAEAMAVYLAVQKAREYGFSHISIASDSSTLIKALNLELPSKELHGIIFDILNLSSYFSVISFNFTPRRMNLQADSLAKESLRSFVETQF